MELPITLKLNSIFKVSVWRDHPRRQPIRLPFSRFMAIGTCLLCWGLPFASQAKASEVQPVHDVPTSIHLATLFWPPYTGASLADGGTDTKLLRSMFESLGLSVSVSYVPWPRALAMYRQNQADVVFPMYPERATMRDCLFSPPYKTTILSMIEAQDTPLQWTTLKDLAPYRLGVVRDYLNTPEFDTLARQKILTVETEASDLINIRKVAAGRIDAAVMDPAVYHYLLENEPSLKDIKTRLQVSPHALGERTLHLCFHENDRGRSLYRLFTDALSTRQQREKN